MPHSIQGRKRSRIRAADPTSASRQRLVGHRVSGLLLPSGPEQLLDPRSRIRIALCSIDCLWKFMVGCPIPPTYSAIPGFTATSAAFTSSVRMTPKGPRTKNRPTTSRPRPVESLPRCARRNQGISLGTNRSGRTPSQIWPHSRSIGRSRSPARSECHATGAGSTAVAYPGRRCLPKRQRDFLPSCDTGPSRRRSPA